MNGCEHLCPLGEARCGVRPTERRRSLGSWTEICPARRISSSLLLTPLVLAWGLEVAFLFVQF